jgi:hypothetical protein
MPEGGQNLCRLADIHSKSLLLQIVRQGDPQKMVALIEKLGRDGAITHEAAERDRQTKPGKPQGLRHQLQTPTKAFKLQLRFYQVTRRSRRGNCRTAGNHQRAPGAVTVLAAGCWLLAAGCWLLAERITKNQKSQEPGAGAKSPRVERRRPEARCQKPRARSQQPGSQATRNWPETGPRPPLS